MWRPFVITIIAVLAPCQSVAQAPRESWDNLRQLSRGEDIEVVDTHMKSHRGTFVTYTQDAIDLRSQGRDLHIVRAEVASVKRHRQSHRRRNALVGLAIGAATGLAVGAIRGKTYHEQGETPVFIAVWTPIGAGVGAIAGAVLPSGREITIYRADRVVVRD